MSLVSQQTRADGRRETEPLEHDYKDRVGRNARRVLERGVMAGERTKYSKKHGKAFVSFPSARLFSGMRRRRASERDEGCVVTRG